MATDECWGGCDNCLNEIRCEICGERYDCAGYCACPSSYGVCRTCNGGELFLLGRLGNRVHLRCRACGYQVSFTEGSDADERSAG